VARRTLGANQVSRVPESGRPLPLSRKCGMRNAERGMGKEEWQMTNGEWQMTNGGWRMANAATKRANQVSRVPESGRPLPLSALICGPDGGKTP
jgi:hypothetical protein